MAKEAIKTKDSVIVVEGYFDAITAHMSGFANTVASLGTALTNEQGKLLVRHTESKRVYLAFDADTAGARATEKGAHILEQLAQGVGIDLRVIELIGGKDPDECLRAKDGINQFNQSLEKSKPLTEYELDQALAQSDSKTRDGRIEAAGKVVPILARIKNAVARSEYIRQMASKLDIQEESLLSDVARQRRVVESSVPYAQQSKSSAAGDRLDSKTTASKGKARLADGLTDAERWLIASFLSDQAGYELAFKSLADEEMMSTVHSRIIKAVYELSTDFKGLADLESKLLDYFAPEPQISAALVEVLFKAEEIRKQKISVPILLLQSRVRLMREKILAETKKLRDQLVSQYEANDSNLFQSKISELSRLERLILPTVTTMKEIDDLKLKMEEINLRPESETQMEKSH